MRALTMADGRRVINLIDRSQRHSLDRARTDFVANASHELRTPLAAILGFVETLTDDQAGGDAPTRVRFLGVIQSEARRMQNLVEDLMSLSRIEADKHQRPTAVVDFGALARQAVDELRDAEGLRRDNIALAIASDLPSVLGDRAQLLQVVHNLLDNALKYGRTNGQVTAALVRVGNDRIRLSVVDQGDGIAPEHLPRLTERFYRVDPGRSRAGGGTGLGLAIVKHIVERHRGVLEIASTVGTGTTVTVMLPVAPGAAHGSAAFDLRQ
jgi:two-component system phosphate regulon sensor histidine kinase PhoR